MSEFVTINNVVFDRSKVSCLVQDPRGDENIVVVYFDNGQELKFVGSEAAEVWREFDKDDYTKDA